MRVIINSVQRAGHVCPPAESLVLIRRLDGHAFRAVMTNNESVPLHMSENKKKDRRKLGRIHLIRLAVNKPLY